MWAASAKAGKKNCATKWETTPQFIFQASKTILRRRNRTRLCINNFLLHCQLHTNHILDHVMCSIKRRTLLMAQAFIVFALWGSCDWPVCSCHRISVGQRLTAFTEAEPAQSWVELPWRTPNTVWKASKHRRCSISCSPAVLGHVQQSKAPDSFRPGVSNSRPRGPLSCRS